MVKVKGNYERVPGWLRVNRQFVPDFLVKDPRQDFIIDFELLVENINGMV